MPAPAISPRAPITPCGCAAPVPGPAPLPPLLYAGGQAPVTRMLARLACPPLARAPRAVATQASRPPEPSPDGPSLASPPVAPEDALATIDRELAQLFAARELYMAWVQVARAEGTPDLNPATFLRAWCDSTGRVIQLLRARRDLGGGDAADALLDAVYAELELQLPAISTASASAELELQLPAISTASASAELELQLPVIASPSACAGPAPVAAPGASHETAGQAGFRNRESS